MTDHDKVSLETALRFLESLSNSRALTDRAIKNCPAAIDSAMALISKVIGSHALPPPAREVDDDYREKRVRREAAPQAEEDLFG
jgi:hypothetical protein